MLELENEIIVRNFILIVAAAIGLLMVFGYYLRNSSIRFLPFGRRASDVARSENRNEKPVDVAELNHNWTDFEVIEGYQIDVEEPYVIFEISAFQSKMQRIEKLFQAAKEFLWYEFSNSKIESEKIMLPILKKIRSKYRGKFEHVNPIHVARVEKENIHLYTWLRNETHIQATVFHFLDEILNLARRARVYPSLSIVWSDIISIEASLPHHPLLIHFGQDMRDKYNAEYAQDDNRIVLKLWLAFSREKVPDSLKESEKTQWEYPKAS